MRNIPSIVSSTEVKSYTDDDDDFIPSVINCIIIIIDKLSIYIYPIMIGSGKKYIISIVIASFNYEFS